jgi:hypothetical protein
LASSKRERAGGEQCKARGERAVAKNHRLHACIPDIEFWLTRPGEGGRGLPEKTRLRNAPGEQAFTIACAGTNRRAYGHVDPQTRRGTGSGGSNARFLGGRSSRRARLRRCSGE